MTTRHALHASSARRAEPCTLVLFGVTGDLARRKLFASLWDLWQQGWLGEGFRLLGIARQDLSDEAFRDLVKKSLDQHGHVSDDEWKPFARCLAYISGDFADDALYKKLAQQIADSDSENVLYYLATPPRFYDTIAEHLHDHGIAGGREGGSTRIIIEKPFGKDVSSARALNESVTRCFQESQIFRIDHYLGKETVQNILVFRFANGIFEPVWNRSYVDNVQITVSENLGLEGRSSYYEQAGAIRDMVQNHMLQLLTLTAMEPPVNFAADSVRDEKVKVLHAVQRYDSANVADHVVLGQYGAGAIGSEQVPSYLQEEGVREKSTTETFAALRLFIDNWRWAGVPFYLRTGKRLRKRSTQISIVFRRAPYLLFRGMGEERMEPNVLTLHIQPDEGISLSFGAKLPGPRVRLRTVHMDFLYGTSFVREPTDAYSRLLHDALLGDSTLFTRGDEVEAAWDIVDGVLEGIEKHRLKVLPYPAGSWGPAEADQLLEASGARFRRP